MKAIARIAGLALLLAFCGCASQSRVTFNTLASVQSVTTAAYNSYLDLVLQKQLPTNSVPVVSRDYNLFQLVWNATVIVAQWNTNAPPTQPVTDAAAKVIADINQAKTQ